MDKSYFEKYIMYDIDNGIRKHHYRISPLVEQRIKDRVHQYVMNLMIRILSHPLMFQR